MDGVLERHEWNELDGTGANAVVVVVVDKLRLYVLLSNSWKVSFLESSSCSLDYVRWNESGSLHSLTSKWGLDDCYQKLPDMLVL